MAKLGTSLLAAWTISCATDKLPCTDSGDAWLTVPQSRVSALLELQVEGPCEAPKPTDGCTISSCVKGGDGQDLRLVAVHARSPGTCTVTVTYTDDCPPESVAYTFGGPLDNCCADACIRTNKTKAAAACVGAP